MRLLLVEDERALSYALVNMFEKEKIDVTACYDGREGLEYALSGAYDLIILDVLMPKMNGFDVLKEVRKNKITTPVLMLTALSGEMDKVKGLDLGADDYLAKPFGFSELMARVRALLRRGQSTLAIDNRLSYGNTELDLANSVLKSGTNEVQLSQKELGIVKYFFERVDFVAHKEEIITRVWGLDNDFLSNNLEVYISFIRKKLAFIGADFTIETVRGIGYKLQKK
ncbi:MAG: response regulator transcription factor [Clostridia bacterium]|nr:response regulator transcription factor [Clostridia bacterium]